MRVGGEDYRDAPPEEHLQKTPRGIYLADRLAQPRSVHVDRNPGFGYRVGGLLEHRGDVALRTAPEDLDEVGVSYDVEASGEGCFADVLEVALVELVGLVLVVDLAVVGVVHVLAVDLVYAADDVVVGEGARDPVHLLLRPGHEVYLYAEPQLKSVNLFARPLEGREVYVIQIPVVLGYAHLNEPPLLRDLAVAEDVFGGHRAVSVGNDVQMIVDHRGAFLLSCTNDSGPYLIRCRGEDHLKERSAALRTLAYIVTGLLSAAAVVSALTNAPTIFVFTVSALALVGLAWVLGQATDSLGAHAGPRIGGILNATFGNAAELIITIFALSAGLTTVVKASIIGSVIGNVLLVLGMSVLFGGLKNGPQKFSQTVAGANSAMLVIVAIGLSIPTIFANTGPREGSLATEYLSIGVAVVLVVLYILSLVFYFTEPEAPSGAGEPPAFGPRASAGLLALSTGAVSWISEIFVGAIEPLVKEIGISELFIGVILVPIIGNVAEHVVGVKLAYENKIEFSMFTSVGSSLQVALLVTPVLVFLGPLLGHPLHLTFSALELGSLAAAAIVAAIISLDGRSNWLEGAMLCGVYAVVALAFFFSG